MNKLPHSRAPESSSADPESTAAGIRRHPSWLHRPIPDKGRSQMVRELLRRRGLHTVCEEARCPNRGECFGKGTATFLIMGDRCTRACRFCNVLSDTPLPIDPEEPRQIASMVAELGLRYVVLTSVTRDDLADGGSGHFCACIRELRNLNSGILIEVLVPDFQGRRESVDEIARARPDVFNHNIETVPRLYPEVRPQADYQRSLQVLRQAAGAGLTTKSGLMVGLGERSEEIETVLADLAVNGCQIVTVGQYLQPDKRKLVVTEYIDPALFEHYRIRGEEAGIQKVIAGPYVRSSYQAEQAFAAVQKK